MEIVIVDTSILFSALQSPYAKARDILLDENNLRLYCPNYVLIELLNHRKRLQKISKLTEPELAELITKLVRRIHFVNEAAISLKSAVDAWFFCKGVDEDDTPFIALVIELDGKFWTKDDELKTGLRAKGFDRFFEP